MSDISQTSVRVLRRAFDILEAFDERTPVITLQKISERIGLPKTTTFRLLATLVETGYVLQTGNQEYCLSHKFMGLAAVAQATFDIHDLVRPTMERIREATQETVDLSVRDGISRIAIHVLESPLRIKNIIHPGEIVSLHLGAVGKVLLAFADEDLTERLLLSAEAEGIDPDKLREQVREARRSGYAYTSSERVQGASAIAAPVRDHTGYARYALAVTGPSYRFDEHADAHRKVLLEGAQHISSLLGWTGHRQSSEASPPELSGV